MKITTAVIPAAGFGTRFLPFTKAVPKELAPLGNKPAIQYIMQEIADAGLEKSVIVTAPGKEALRHYFEPDNRLEEFLKEKHKQELLAPLNTLCKQLTFSYVMQNEAKGLGDAISCAQAQINEDYFAVLLPDDIIFSSTPAIKQLLDVAQKHSASVIAVQEVPRNELSAYGVVRIGTKFDEHTFSISGVVEKPPAQSAPSNYAIVGRYILNKDIFSGLQQIKPSANGELQLTDAIEWLISNKYPVIACIFEGNRHDVGTPTGWLAANVAIVGSL